MSKKISAYIGINSSKKSRYISFKHPFTGKITTRGFGFIESKTDTEVDIDKKELEKLLNSLDKNSLIAEKALQLGISEEIAKLLIVEHENISIQNLELSGLKYILEMSKNIKYCEDTGLLGTLSAVCSTIIKACEARVKTLDYAESLSDIESKLNL